MGSDAVGEGVFVCCVGAIVGEGAGVSVVQLANINKQSNPESMMNLFCIYRIFLT